MNLTVKKSIVLDENQTPVGVLISYKDWLYIEKMLNTITETKSPRKEIKNVGGSLKKYANHSLIDKENQAWENHIKEKYAGS